MTEVNLGFMRDHMRFWLRWSFVRTLPFHAWPISWQGAAWALSALLSAISFSLRLNRDASRTHEQAANAQKDVTQRLRAAEHRLAARPALEKRAAQLPVAMDNKNAESELAAPAGNRTQNAVSATTLLAWLEQIVLASGMQWISFEPASSAHQASFDVTTSTPISSTPEEIDLIDLNRESSRLSLADEHRRGAVVKLDGPYPAVHALIERLARTQPTILIDNAALVVSGTRLSLTMHIGVADEGIFQIGEITDRADPVDPFARKRLPEATASARLLGILAQEGRFAALMTWASHIMLLEVGAVIGDATITAVTANSVSLLPFAGAVTTLRLGEQP